MIVPLISFVRCFVSNPSNSFNQSKCHHLLRNSPSVTYGSLCATSFSTNAAISLSSTFVNSSLVIFPSLKSFLAFLIASGRKKDPTISYVNFILIFSLYILLSGILFSVCCAFIMQYYWRNV